jgi:hypothetical protein
LIIRTQNLKKKKNRGHNIITETYVLNRENINRAEHSVLACKRKTATKGICEIVIRRHGFGFR